MADNGLMIASSLLLAALLLMAAISDLRAYRVPNAISFALIISGLAQAALMGGDLTGRALGAALGYGVLALWGEIYYRMRGREGLGLGDAKLFGAAGAWLGWQALPMTLLLASASGLAFALAARKRDADRIAFAPFLAAAIFILWLGRLAV